MSVKIYVMTHKEFPVPSDPMYIPLHVGREGKEDLGYQGDNTGKNISSKNCYYSELTGLYWMANNVTDVDYLGLCHYRRYFLKEDGRLLDEAFCEQILREYDVILAKAVFHPKSYYEVYKEAHNIRDLEVTGEVLKRLYPEVSAVYDEIIQGTKVYSGNMFITSRSLLAEYTQWLFPIFDEVEKRINPDAYDAYHRRVYGFLSEQLLYVWVKSKGLKIFEAPVGLTQEKAETMELKTVLRERMARGTLEGVQEALAVFRGTMKDRPDLMLAASDLSGELADMFRIIYVCEQELLSGERGMMAITTDLSMLLKHFRLLCSIAVRIAEETATPQELAYFKDSRISESLLKIILNSNPNIAAAACKIKSVCDI